MKQLPSNIQAYKKTPEFNQDSIPKGLLNDHQTMQNVWGVIEILEGELEYIIQTDPVEVVKLSKRVKGIVEPQQSHHVKTNGPVRFYVEFYK